ncbi:hypothetical protein JHFBIEKO_5355 [Methylobacterium mesophilicum]|nr:hypothetical protein JHFBIEKO_5355 [Methylobacterium mesophilicum]
MLYLLVGVWVSKMQSTCCCYTVDEKYLMPAVVSATQMRQRIQAESVDVLIICFGNRTSITDLFKEICSEENIIFILVPSSVRDGLSMYYARFFIDRVIDQKYRKVFYIDSDTQLVGSVDALINHEITRNSILAVLDPASLVIENDTRKNQDRRNYLSSIGLPRADHKNYFNSGVLLASKSDWESFSKDSLSLIKNSKVSFQFPDQDPLNVVARNCVIQGSFKWNFPAFFFNFNLDREIEPCICHFMSNPRPWQGNFAPWTKDWCAPYEQLMDRSKSFRVMYPKLNFALRIKYILRQRYVELVEGAVWRSPSTIYALRRAEAQACF